VGVVAVLLPDMMRVIKALQTEVHRASEGRGGHRWSSWSLMWPFGQIADVQGKVLAVLLLEYRRRKKNPVNVGLQGL
jgi:hypothetical protein